MSFTPPGNNDVQLLQQIKGNQQKKKPKTQTMVVFPAPRLLSENVPVSGMNSNVPLYTVYVFAITEFNLLYEK